MLRVVCSLPKYARCTVGSVTINRALAPPPASARLIAINEREDRNMDPQATINNLRAAIACGDYSEAVAALANYYEWRLAGGFEPLNGDRHVSVLASNLSDALEEVEES